MFLLRPRVSSYGLPDGAQYSKNVIIRARDETAQGDVLVAHPDVLAYPSDI